MAKIIVDVYGTKRYYNDAGRLHREDGPALIHNDGSARWYLNDRLRRDDGPAVKFSSGTMQWYDNTIVSRSDGPSLERPDGYKAWIKHMYVQWPEL